MNARAIAKRVVGAAILGIAALALALALRAATMPIPDSLFAIPTGGSVRVSDRDGALLHVVRGDDGEIADPIEEADVPDVLRRAMIAAEDARFERHFGLDPIAIARAAGQLVVHRRIVSGASTITQQLARTLVPRPRTVFGKLSEMALALRLEASLSKRRILSEYLNRVAFGPNLRGVSAASRAYLGKPARELSIAEAALLASLPRGPTLYDPRRGLERIRRRRDRVIDRMLAAKAISQEEARVAKGEPIVLRRPRPAASAFHFVHAVTRGPLAAGQGASAVETTLSAPLQREIEGIVVDALGELASRHVTAASVVVLENATGDVLAWVGSPDPFDVARLGGNDGVLALRQPGSSLKPFVYELGIERLGWTPATLLPDVELRLPVGDGEFRPQNYDGRFHGPVRLREALANSYNVPAVWAASVLGPARVLDRLRALGLGTLAEGADHYGAAIALGDGEVRLLDLANAYATLARGGIYVPVRAVRAWDERGTRVEAPTPEGTRVLDATAVSEIVDVLRDDRARMASFGEHSALDPGFVVAAKTGTSKGFRDNVAVGFARDVTVAVWVGNFDGSPMRDVSGITGAGPIFRDAIAAAARDRTTPALANDDGEDVEICPLSGKLASPSCPHRRREHFPRGKAPTDACAMHETVLVDRRNGLPAGRACPRDVTEPRTFELYPPAFEAWARATGRPILPPDASPNCPEGATVAHGRGDAIRIVYPLDGARFVHDPSVARELQRIAVRIEAPASIARARLTIDGSSHEVSRPFAADVPLTPGNHVVRVDAGGASDEVAIQVE